MLPRDARDFVWKVAVRTYVNDGMSYTAAIMEVAADFDTEERSVRRAVGPAASF